MKPHKLIIIKQNPPCPKCGGQTRLRKPRDENDLWLPFYGCVNYPECRGSVKILLHSEAQLNFWDKPETMEVWSWV